MTLIECAAILIIGSMDYVADTNPQTALVLLISSRSNQEVHSRDKNV